MSYPGKAYDEMTNQLLSPSGYENPQAKKRYHLAVIGAGPAGLVTAISAAGLGANVALIESRSMGGDCLNVGCIPSKSLLNLSENFYKAQNFSKLGIEIGDLKLNLEKMMKNKDRAVTVLTKGIEFLFKKNKIAHFKGLGVLKSKNEVLIIDENKNEKTIEAEKIIISSGSEPISFPGTKFDEQNIVKFKKTWHLHENIQQKNEKIDFCNNFLTYPWLDFNPDNTNLESWVSVNKLT